MTDNDKTDQKNNARSAFDKKKRRGPDDPPLSEARHDELSEKMIGAMNDIAKGLKDQGLDGDALDELMHQELAEYRREKKKARLASKTDEKADK